MKYTFNKLILYISIAGTVHIVSCRVMPAQMSRVYQSERYVQSFDFGDPEGSGFHDDVDEILNGLIGTKNLEVLNPIISEIHEAAERGQIEARGYINSSLSIVPTNHDLFFVEGTGRYTLIAKESSAEEITLYTADFTIIPEHFSISDLGNKPIQLRFTQHLINHFASPEKKFNYVHDKEIDVFLYTTKLTNLKDVYQIDYDVNHSVQIDGKHIGSIRFTPPVHEKDKVIDLRGKKFLKNDY